MVTRRTPLRRARRPLVAEMQRSLGRLFVKSLRHMGLSGGDQIWRPHLMPDLQKVQGVLGREAMAQERKAKELELRLLESERQRHLAEKCHSAMLGLKEPSHWEAEARRPVRRELLIFYGRWSLRRSSRLPSVVSSILAISASMGGGMGTFKHETKANFLSSCSADILNRRLETEREGKELGRDSGRQRNGRGKEAAHQSQAWLRESIEKGKGGGTLTPQQRRKFLSRYLVFADCARAKRENKSGKEERGTRDGPWDLKLKPLVPARPGPVIMPKPDHENDRAGPGRARPSSPVLANFSPLKLSLHRNHFLAFLLGVWLDGWNLQYTSRIVSFMCTLWQACSPSVR
ncbi:hypothetical protein AXF42_Ash005191 [Apostasia shenzhenica]|uniref:Uncharacterized protein n=1 Tax=Apostasia shenzhenica TaxID=1088818 RepID=A0A2I0B8P7_9ASPA|nr:hypothetical protein AXF42_Ash005191 [Apostasia shenzhenica]